MQTPTPLTPVKVFLKCLLPFSFYLTWMITLLNNYFILTFKILTYKRKRMFSMPSGAKIKRIWGFVGIQSCRVILPTCYPQLTFIRAFEPLVQKNMQWFICVCGWLSISPIGFYSWSESIQRVIFKRPKSSVLYLHLEHYFSFFPTEQISPAARPRLFISIQGKGQFSTFGKDIIGLTISRFFFLNPSEKNTKERRWDSCSLNLCNVSHFRADCMVTLQKDGFCEIT